jgi:hypothetical protein
MIIKNTPRDRDGNRYGEAMRPMIDSEIRANLLDGILSGTHKVSKFFKEILFIRFKSLNFNINTIL